MASYPTLQILEGENLSLSLHGDDDNQFLFGDESGSNLYQISKSLDHIRKNYYSPLYRQYIPVNAGFVNPSHTLEGEDGNFYHFDAQENFLGCSFCSIASTLAGDEIREFHHFNADGTLAGVTVTDENGKEFLYEGAYELSGFKFGKIGGFKMPKMKIKLPKMKLKVPKIKMPQMPKIKMPKLPSFKMPNIKMPKFKMPKLPNVGKAVGKVTDQIGKGIGNVGNQIGKGVNKWASNIGEGFQAVGDLATGLMDTAGSLLSPGGEQMPQEGQEGQEEGSGELTPQDPGYTDENGYTASDGVYYSHDNTSYFDFQKNEWIPLNAEQEQGTDFSQVGYTDENGFRADDRLFYSHDGQYILNEQTNEWIPR